MKHLKQFENFNNITLYHGSNHLFDEFKLTQGKRTSMMFTETIESLGIFLTPNRGVAISYTNPNKDSYLYTCEINYNNIISWKGGVDEITYSKFENNIPFDETELWMLLDDKEVVKSLKDRGIDCVLLEEYSEMINDVYDVYFIMDVGKINIINRGNINI